MQVIHPFVYLLPIIFLFGVRRTPGVLATLVFALPPIVRLTNLGVRQVPADVVEAARAFGATESRVLREVQLPLARPAIMAGLNQTLLLSLSMVGIVAIIAGGGLGKPILTALATADIPLGASAGAGLYFVGVLLDRISQPEASDKRLNLFSRMRDAWSTRSDPAVPPMPDPAADSGFVTSREAPITLRPAHRLAAGVSVVAGLLAAVASILPWVTVQAESRAMSASTICFCPAPTRVSTPPADHISVGWSPSWESAWQPAVWRLCCRPSAAVGFRIGSLVLGLWSRNRFSGSGLPDHQDSE